MGLNVLKYHGLYAQTTEVSHKEKMQFEQLNIIAPIQKALKEEGYTVPTPIQAKAIGPLLEGRDLLGTAQTGTGKTAAFAIPILQGINGSSKTPRRIQALILAPTRELAIQIQDSFKTYGKYLNTRTIAVYGGVSQRPQTTELARGIDILVATPGRLLDLINQKFIHLDKVKYFVLDEADMMLDMGMIHDVRKIIGFLPHERQTMFFSATMPKEIVTLSHSILKDPVKAEVTPAASTVDTINQHLYFVDKPDKIHLLIHLLKTLDIESVLVFSRTKHGADKIVKALVISGLPALAIHGNKSQNARQAALKSFKDRKTKILVATDIAARGLDIDELSHVLIYDLPEVSETYVHRIGRTGRAGLGGTAISFCDTEERGLLRDIEKLIDKSIPIVHEHPFSPRGQRIRAVEPIFSSKPGAFDKKRHNEKDPARFHRQKPQPAPSAKKESTRSNQSSSTKSKQNDR